VGGAIGSLKGEEDIAHYGRLGDEGDDAHVASTIGATEREHVVDASQQYGPRVASGAAVEWFVGGRCLVGSGRDRSERHRRHGESGDRGAQRQNTTSLFFAARAGNMRLQCARPARPPTPRGGGDDFQLIWRRRVQAVDTTFGRFR